MNNEVRPIDANALENHSHPCVRGTYGYSAKVEDWMVSVDDIRNEPTLDYEPVRYGHWERSKDFYGFVRCSNCKSKKSEHWHIEDEWEYCNCCGCKMIKENEDD